MAMVFPINATPEGGYGMQAARLGNALQEQRLKNRMQELENQMYMPKTQSDIDYKNALTQGQTIDNRFAPERNQLANQHSGLVNQFYAPNIQSEIGLRNATAANTRAEIPFIGQKYANQTRNSLTSAGTLNNQVGNSFREWSRTPEGQQIIKNRPDIANAILTQMENQSGQITGNPVNNMPQPQSQNQLGITPGLIFAGNIDLTNRPKVKNSDGSFSTVRTITAEIDGKTVLLPTIDDEGNKISNKEAVENYKRTGKSLGVFETRKDADSYDQKMHENMGWNGKNNSWEKPVTEKVSREQIITDIQRGAADAYEKQNLPADTKKRLYAGDRFKTAIPSVIQNFEKASVYFSPKGQAKLKADEARAFKDKRVPTELQAYRQFKQGLEFMKVSGAFLEGVPADQVSRQAYGKIYDISHFFNNPADAMDSLKYAVNLALMADQTNRKSLSELKQESPNDSVIGQMMNQKNPSEMTIEEIQAELKKYGK